jgi:hypothetical protein
MVSEHFSWDEVVTTQTGLDNEIPEVLKPNAVRLAETVLEPLRVFLGPMHVDSWYRSPGVNKAVGGVENSYHRLGLAADIVPNGDVFNAFQTALIHLHVLPIDKIIYEKHNSPWIHVQAAKDRESPKHLAFTAEPNSDGHMVYSRYEA